MDHVLSCLNPEHEVMPYFAKIYSSVISHSVTMFTIRSVSFVLIKVFYLHSTHTTHVQRPAYRFLRDRIIYKQVVSTKTLITQREFYRQS